MKVASLGAAIAGAVFALLIREALLPDRDGRPALTAQPSTRIEGQIFRQHIEPDNESIRRAIREELAIVPLNDIEDAEDEQGEIAPPPARRADVEAARAIVSDAVIAGRWTQSDVERIRMVMPRLDPASLDEVLSQFTMAVNAQKLKIEAPPL